MSHSSPSSPRRVSNKYGRVFSASYIGVRQPARAPPKPDRLLASFSHQHIERDDMGPRPPQRIPSAPTSIPPVMSETATDTAPSVTAEASVEAQMGSPIKPSGPLFGRGQSLEQLYFGHNEGVKTSGLSTQTEMLLILTVFLCGLAFPPVWFLGFFFLKSDSKAVKFMASSGIGFGVLGTMFLVVYTICYFLAGVYVAAATLVGTITTVFVVICALIAWYFVDPDVWNDLEDMIIPT